MWAAYLAFIYTHRARGIAPITRFLAPMGFGSEIRLPQREPKEGVELQVLLLFKCQQIVFVQFKLSRYGI